MNKQDVLSRKTRSYAEVKVEKVSNPSICILDKAKPVQTDIGGHLRKADLEHGLELTQPEDRNQTKGHGNVFVIYRASQSEPAFSNSGKYAQQGEFVGRGLRVFQDNVVDNRKSRARGLIPRFDDSRLLPSLRTAERSWALLATPRKSPATPLR